MTRSRSLLALATVAILGIATIGISLAASATDDGPNSTFSLAEAQTFTEFPVYYAGPAVDGVPLVAVLRRDDSANYVSFIYDECDAKSETGCAPPGEVQVWPACQRNLSLYAGARSSISPVPESTTVRGAPAAFFENGSRLEIQTGASTVVVFGGSSEWVLRLANALRGVNVGVQAGELLPPPVAGALDGTLECAA